MKIAQTPLATLVTPEGVPCHRIEDRTRAEIRELLASGSVRFVVAEAGAEMLWIPESKKFVFWKSEALGHIADEEKTRLEDSPDGYFYRASEWRADSETQTVILLEKSH